MKKTLKCSRCGGTKWRTLEKDHAYICRNPRCMGLHLTRPPKNPKKYGDHLVKAEAV